jgi:hypothetical protein
MSKGSINRTADWNKYWANRDKIDFSKKTETPVQTDVHIKHCCKKCGCKYGEGEEEFSPDYDDGFIPCSVVSGRKKQDYKCGELEVCNPS